MARVDCPFCGKLGSLYAERIVRGQTSVTTYFCDACYSEWDEREGDEARELPRPRKRLPMTRRDKEGEH